MVTEGELSEVELIMKESLNLHRDSQTAPAASWCCTAHEKSRYRSSELGRYSALVYHLSSYVSIYCLKFSNISSTKFFEVGNLACMYLKNKAFHINYLGLPASAQARNMTRNAPHACTWHF